MHSSTFNLFIIDKDRLMAKSLQFFLSRRFGSTLNITVFNNAALALSEVTEKTDIVIVDSDLHENSQMLNAIKLQSPLTEVILLTSNEDVFSAIESFRNGAKDVIIKDSGSVWQNVSTIVYKIITYPIHLLVREFSVSKYMAIFLLTFFTMAVTVTIVLNMF